MRRSLAATLATLLVAVPVYAALPDGAKAPDFSTQATLAGKEFKFSLADALKKGPVVLYFYPAAFTPGCTVEAHEFAEATASSPPWAPPSSASRTIPSRNSTGSR